MNRDQRAALAQETLAILDTGRYQAPSGRTVEIGDAIRESVEKSRLYRPDDFPESVEVPGSARRAGPTSVEVTAETSLQAARRLERLLWVAWNEGHEDLVLGAWGCGVFANDPEMIAGLFAEALGPGGMFDRCFERVVHAVYDRTPGQAVLSVFRQVLENHS